MLRYSRGTPRWYAHARLHTRLNHQTPPYLTVTNRRQGIPSIAEGGTADTIWGSGDVTSGKYGSAGGGIDKFGSNTRRGSAGDASRMTASVRSGGAGGADGEASVSPVPEGTRRSSRRRGSDGDQARGVVSPTGLPPPPGSHLTSSPPTDVDASPSSTPPPSYMEVTAGGDFVPIDGGEGGGGRQQLPGSPAGREREEGNGSRRGSQYGAEGMAAGEQEGVEGSLRARGLGHGPRVVTVDLYRSQKKERRGLDQRRRDRSEPLADICLSSPSLSPKNSPQALSPSGDPSVATSFTTAASASSEAMADSTAPAAKADVSYVHPTCASAGGGADEASGGVKKWSWHGVTRTDGSGGSGSAASGLSAKAAIPANSLMITTDNQGYVRVYAKEALLEALSRKTFGLAAENEVENGRAGGAGEGSSSGDRAPRRLQQ